MSGKAYTMKEMKGIVEYLTEQKAYSDIKGRKMWMDFASSEATTRTWQSLKETFLKRILPDIHNPYYKLSVHQLASFKQGCDIEAKLNNKLEIQSTDAVSLDITEDDSSKETDQVEKEVENNEDISTGEDLQQLNSNVRDSTDTLVLENCYQTAEDIKKDVQSANEDDDKEDDNQPKSLRDLITYSEPLNMLQTTIDDFATDEEGSNGELQMQIVEPEEIAKKDGHNGDNCIVEIADSDSGDKDKANESLEKQNADVQIEENEKESANSIADVVEIESKKDNESAALFPENNTANEAEDISKTEKNDNQRKSSEITQNTNTITESLPNNQEAFHNKTEQSSKKKQLSNTKQDKKESRKRASSQETLQPKDNKKRHLNLKKQSISDTETALCKDKKKLDPKIVEEKLNKIEEVNKPAGIEMSPNIVKTIEGVTVNASDFEQQVVDMTTSDIENPCLKSVSLYEEELSYNQKLESQRGENENSKEPTKNNINDVNEIVILKSHSDSVSDSSKVLTPPKKGKQSVTKQHRDKAIADVFGLSRGGVTKKRKRNVSYKQSSGHHAHHISSGSSEWTSETDSEFISPPRGRKNRQTRKYLKPKPARILSLEEEGGLFVMYGKKIYPIVKDGKIIKNYVTYTPEEEVDHEESYWKLKYVEEKKRTDELTKLLNEVKEKTEDNVNQVPAVTLIENKISNLNQKQLISVNQAVADKRSTESVQNKTETEDKTVKFKFIKNNEELQLEGHWSHVNPVLAQVMQLLQKDEQKDTKAQTNPPIHENKKKTKTANEQKITKQSISNVNGANSDLEVPVTLESGQSTPIIPVDVEDEIKEKVNKIENEIFKEIEEMEMEEESTKKTTSQSEEHITKRRGRPRKSSASSVGVSGSPKKSKPDIEPNKDKEITDANKKNSSEPRKTRSPKKSLNESPKEGRTRKSLSRKSKEVGSSNVDKKEVEQARYKFPSPPPTRKSKIAKASKPKANIYLTSLEKVHSSPESRSFCSIDNTQCYQDSDEGEIRMPLRKRTSTVPYKKKSLSRYRTNSHPFLTDDITSESSNSCHGFPLKTVTFQNSTISSENYSSESYRLLMNKNLTQKQNMFPKLERIEECPNLNDLKCMSEQIYEDMAIDDCKVKGGTFKIAHAEEDSTSNVSLPTSPVLSIVENISVSKDLLSSVDDFPVVQLQYNDQIVLNDFIKCETDVSMPLMARDCAIENNGCNGGEYHYNLNAVKDTPISETSLNKVNTVNIKDPALTDSINTKLKDLMLESTKKILKNGCDHNNNIENAKEVNADNTKTKTRKRSSTPRKRKNSRRLTLAINEPCIEEHTENCSYSRQSCPPVVQYFENIDINANITENVANVKTRQKKDVIKVKITKPKPRKKSITDTISEKGVSKVIGGSVNDSESGVYLQCFNDSVDLIHNHSDTCLNAHDCMGDSVELLEDSKSVIFLNSTIKSEHLVHKYDDNINNLEYELFSSDAQDGSELGKVNNASFTMYHSFMAHSPQNSLITEDLSDGSPVKNIKDGGKITRNTKWYLLSEDETTNTNLLDINQNSVKGIACGSNLNQIFPITCAVPDLSTITELSNQNDENLKKLGNETL